MYYSHKTYITGESKMLDLIYENHLLLLFLQHLHIDFTVGNKSVNTLCKEYAISPTIFIPIANLYNGFYPDTHQHITYTNKETETVLSFLKSSHSFYLKEKFPELTDHLEKLTQTEQKQDYILLKKFYQEYFQEVKEHLKYEDEIVFPYITNLLANTKQTTPFSVHEYRNHHTDIETKLTDLKNLFLKHLNIKNSLPLQRKFLNILFELEFDLKIHAIIEDEILVPIIEKIEINI